MRKKLTPVLIWASLATLAQAATIRIDVDHVIDAVDPRIYGIFMEPIGFNRADLKFNTLYGPVYDPKSPLADEHGFRKDMIDAARELRLTNMRWPGGNFTSSYDWRDGIGPKDKRPKRLELAWGVVESNQVGTDEWVQLNQAIGSENVVCINMGTGTGLFAGQQQSPCHWLPHWIGASVRESAATMAWKRSPRPLQPAKKLRCTRLARKCQFALRLRSCRQCGGRPAPRQFRGF